MDKALYGARGDVDIAGWLNPATGDDELIGVEVKTQWLNKAGDLKSQKPQKHEKQLINLQRDGWDFVWLFDFVVTEPAAHWLHPQAGDSFDKYNKAVAEGFGHAVFQVNAIEGRPESEAGSINSQVLSNAVRQSVNPNRERIVAALMQVFRPNVCRSGV